MNKKNYKPKGLENLSLNCYMNSLMQCLYYCVDFRNEFLKLKFDDSQPISKLLKALMLGLKNKNSNYNFFNPKNLKKELNNYELFRDGKMADVTDLLMTIFDSIIDEYNINEDSFCETVNYEDKIYNKLAMYNDIRKDINFNLIINKFFLGFYEKEYKCQINHLKYSFQNEYRIIFPLEMITKTIRKDTNLNIYDCFNYNYKNEINSYEKCYKNECKNNVFINEKIYESPNILIIILDRGPNKKYNNTIKFYEYINISDYLDEAQTNKNMNEYKLIGVITHFAKDGSYGHYISYCLCDDNNFYCLNDSHTQLIAQKGKKNSIDILYNGSPYVLFYQRLKQNEQKNYLFYDDEINSTHQILNFDKKSNFKKIIKESVDQICYKNHFKLKEEKAHEWVYEKNNNITLIISFHGNKSSILYKQYNKISELKINQYSFKKIKPFDLTKQTFANLELKPEEESIKMFLYNLEVLLKNNGFI